MLSLRFVKVVDLVDSLGELGSTLLGLVSADGNGGVVEQSKSVSFLFSLLSITLGTSEEILIFLLWEVIVVHTVSVGVFGWIVPVVLPERVGSQVSGFTV